MSPTLDLPTFSGPLTAVALNEWMQKCFVKATHYMNDNKIAEKNEFLVAHIGDKISDDGDTHDLADWYQSSGYLIRSWEDFREAVMTQALGSQWLARAIGDLYRTKQGGRSGEAYFRDLKEKLSVLEQSFGASNTATRRKLPLDENHFKYLLLFNADPTVLEQIINSRFNILDANVQTMKEEIVTASQTTMSASKPNNEDAPTASSKPQVQSLLNARWTAHDFHHFSDRVQCVAFTPDNSVMAVSCSTKTLWFVDLRSGGVHFKVDLPKLVTRLKFAGNDYLVLPLEYELRVWKWRTTSFESGSQIILPETDHFRQFAISQNAQRVAVQTPNNVIFYSLITFSQELSVPNVGGEQVAFSPDCNLVANRRPPYIYIYDVAQRAVIETIHTPGKFGTFSLAFSPTGKHLALATNEPCIRVWSLNNKGKVNRGEGNQGEVIHLQLPTVTWLVYSPDGKIFACLSAENIVRIRDAETATELTSFEGSEGLRYGYGVVFSPDGRRLATFPPANDSTVVIYKATWEGVS
ncbi:conserved hypothetical protein [Talaromyces stipitatus ATCC 10500]|uniref:Uncharacterized protein n=1 Tax=Talaromyces stipitatus (strain ATCC 10500 / CBS 375.48 / QM 6759 / NRRL 1006) TaxID=441959 RepID=B8MPR9_TALSN|nr:uncharacterized protein TSTA_052280 [Talaromyces stipitatus ATCC 10500]EED12705.1 conserved hypothetical protein [Talaromyces stipitatus ATCC 10500]